MKKHLIVFGFYACLTLPLGLFLLSPAEQVSSRENRQLAVMPDASLILNRFDQWSGGLERYYEDRFGGRQPLIGIWNTIETTALRENNNPNVVIGSQGWLFQNGRIFLADIKNQWPFSEPQLQQWAMVLSAKQESLDQRGIRYLFVFTPNKNLINGRYLPEFAQPSGGSESRLQQLVQALQSTDVNFVDLRPTMLEAQQHYRAYHKTDTHWNDWGAYNGYRAIMGRLVEQGLELPVINLDPSDFELRDGPSGDLARLLSMEDQFTEQWVSPKKWQPACTLYPELEQIPDWDFMYNSSYKTRCSSGRYRVMIFRDSFSWALAPFLSETFAEIYYYPFSPANTAAMLDLVDRIKPDIVIEQRASRWLRTPEG